MNRSLFVFTLLLASACKTTAPVVPATSSEAVALTYQQPVVASPAGNVKLEFSELADSRCPEGGQCFWAGEARVTLTLTETAAAPQQVRLGLNAGPRLASSLPDSLSIVLHQQPYWVRLLAVTPYPSLNGPKGPQVATVRLRPQ